MTATLRPQMRLLDDALIGRIVGEARDLLVTLGVSIANDDVIALLLEHGAWQGDDGRIRMDADLIDRALATAPTTIALHDRDGALRATLGSGRTYFTPGSSAIHVLDSTTGEIRLPTTPDYIQHVTLSERLDAIDYGATAFVPRDVAAGVSDSYRLYLSLIFGRSPVVTGTFTIEAMAVMADLLLAVRGSEQALADAPLAMFSACPTSPLGWCDVTSRNVLDCARLRIPVEFISMPLTGFVAPGTLVGTLIQHTAETLSGVVISQCAAPGTPIAWGGSPAIFDYRYETPPLGAIESQMIACAYTEIGKHLNLPTQAYIGVSDAKLLDAQAGLESAAGCLLAALAGVDSVSGPGMHDFESCQSLEKLVVDNEICGAAQRLARGIEVRPGDFPSRAHFEELLDEGHLLISRHTRKWFRKEVRFPSPVIDRANLARHREEGAKTLHERARERVAALLTEPPEPIDGARRADLDDIMLAAARAAGMEGLPAQIQDSSTSTRRPT